MKILKKPSLRRGQDEEKFQHKASSVQYSQASNTTLRGARASNLVKDSGQQAQPPAHVRPSLFLFSLQIRGIFLQITSSYGRQRR